MKPNNNPVVTTDAAEATVQPQSQTQLDPLVLGSED
jgi:hypothetical protein